MPPKATTSNNASANASTLNANGQPKRKRTRGRGGRGRGGRGKKDESSDDDSSSSSDDESSDDDEPVASTSKIATAPATAKSEITPVPSKNGKGKSASPSDASSDEESDDEGNASDSSSSSSSFLTTSDEEEDMPVPRNTRGQNTQGSAVDGASTYGQSQRGGAEEDAARGRRPEMTKPNDPPFIQFGADADLAHNVRAFGKPILWGSLPGDMPSTSTSTSALDNDDEADERSKAIIAAEKAKAEERYLKFRDDYVSKMISRFGGSLDVIRQKEADTMKESRLQVLIQSIAGGADTFTSKDGQGIWKTNEMRGEREVVLEGLEKQAKLADTEAGDHDMSQ